MKAIILAAGLSTRMWPLAQHKNKCMYEFLGKPLLQYTIEGLKEKDKIKEFIIVVSPNDSSIKDYFGDGANFGIKVSYATQTEQKGTGNALLAAENLCDEDFILTNGAKTNAGKILKKLPRTTAKAAIAMMKVEKPEDYCVAEIKNSKLVSLTEKPKNPKSKLASVNLFYLPKKFFDYLKKAKQDEYSLITALNEFAKENAVKVFETKEAHYTLKYPWHILEINKLFLNDLKKSSIKGKVHKSVSITGNVIVEEGAVIEENVVINGPCYIGKKAVIRAGCLLRKYSSISENVLLGYNTELKNAVIYKGTKTHQNYIGDSVLDEDIRLGAGTITANRRHDRKEIFSLVKGKKVSTGTTSFGSIIGRKAKTGINCSLMPGVKIGEEAVIWPGIVVFKDVKDRGVLKRSLAAPLLRKG